MTKLGKMGRITPDYFDPLSMGGASQRRPVYIQNVVKEVNRAKDRLALEKYMDRMSRVKWKQEQLQKQYIKQKRKEIREREISYLKSALSSDVRTSKYASISQAQHMTKFYKNKAFPLELKQIIDEFVNNITAAYNQFETQYRALMESRIEEVVEEYENIIDDAMQDAESTHGSFESSEVNEIVDRVYAGLMEGKYSTKGDVVRAVKTMTEGMVNRKGREADNMTYWDDEKGVDTGEVATITSPLQDQIVSLGVAPPPKGKQTPFD